MEVLFGILIPFIGTTLGSACVFFMKRSLGDLVQRALAGFAAGVMVAASIWSLLIPAIEQSEGMGKLSFLPAFIGFWVGVLFLLLLDHLIPHLHIGSDKAEGPKSKLGRTTMMVLAVTLHNIPEGMAVGVMYAGFLAGNSQITAASALVLSLGIAIQNFPEGAIISMPLKAEGESKGKAFLGGVLSGIVEPVGAVLTLLAAQLVIPALPYFLSFAAGAMLYVVVEELIPEMSQGKHSNIGTIFFAVGFSVMMTLDVALGSYLVLKEGTKMIQTTVKISGMACSMCEAHINDTIRRTFSVEKVSSSHTKGETVILSREPLDEAALRAAIDATGYTAGEIRAAPYKKKGLFSFLKK